ncbi:MAG: sterol desaturase family protein [Rhodovibrionaceae bacterium]
MSRQLRGFLAWSLWPGLLAASIFLTDIVLRDGYGILGFNAVYISLAAALFALERLLPYERRWLDNCGQILPDLAHTLLNKGMAQGFVLMGTVFGIVLIFEPVSNGYWPRDWPLALQIVLGLTVSEAALYTAHRLSHEWPLLWRFHAVHHSVRRLWFWNTGRFHFVDTLVSIVLSVPLMLLAGAPEAVIIWANAITAFIGMLTHCNVDLRCGPLSYLFNTPELHRWHHSRKLSEGNKNYGENLMVFDLLLGTFFLPRDRRPPVDIGIGDPMPPSFFGQLAQPFRSCKRRLPAAAAE